MPVLSIDLQKIKKNTSNIIRLLGGIELVAVTKAIAGDNKIARALIEGGATLLLDSRISNLKAYKDLPVKRMLLRLPPNAKSSDVENLVDYYLVSNTEDIVSIEKMHKSKPASIILLIETGFKREGFLEDELREVIAWVRKSKLIKFAGVATCTDCMNGCDPKDQLELFRDIVNKLDLPEGAIVSGGNSRVLHQAFKNNIPKKINQLRVGESILLGHDTSKYKRLLGNATDVFKLKAELIETRAKDGERIGVVGVGVQDIGAGGLTALDDEVLGIRKKYSDYITVSIKRGCRLNKKWLTFKPDYYALMALNSSKYVIKKYIDS